MQVLDHQPNTWFLLEAGEALLFDAACNHSAFGYSWLIELNAEERQAYASGGRGFLDWLAQDIHNGVPILEVSRSPYKTRDRSRAFGAEVTRTIVAWRAARSCPAPNRVV